MTLCRLLYYRYNIDSFAFIPAGHLPRLFLGGLRFDVAMVFYACLLYYAMMIAGAYLPRRLEEAWGWRIVRALGFILPMGLLLLANVADTGYYPYILTRASRTVFVEFEGEDVTAMSADFLVQFWPLTLAFLLLLALVVVGYLALRFRRGEHPAPLRRRLLGTVAGVALLFVGMRGTLRPGVSPLSESLVDRYVASYREVPIVQNTPYTLTRRSGTHFRPYRFYEAEELARLFDPTLSIGPLEEGDTLFGSLRGRNVMVLTMESLAREYCGYLNRDLPDYPSYTPFLDSLMPHTLYAKYGFATGKRSVESMPSIYASIPTFGAAFNDRLFRMDAYQQTRYFTSGLPTALGEEGYEMKFYHGDEPGAMGFYDFLSGMGPLKQYTAEDFSREVPHAEDYFMNVWGVFDRPFEQAMATDMEGLREPFGAFFFSLTNHNPFQLPREYEGQVRPGTLPIHRTCQYADDALRHFFDRIKGEPWYERTVFVITGDHTSLSDRPEYDNPDGRSMVPICFYAPGSGLEGEVADRVAAHTDIYPTLLYLLGIRRTIYSYGHILFDDRADHFALNYLFDRYFLFTTEATVSMGLDGTTDLQPPAALIRPVKGGRPAPQHSSDLLRAIVQDYNSRIFSGDFVWRPSASSAE